MYICTKFIYIYIYIYIYMTKIRRLTLSKCNKLLCIIITRIIEIRERRP
jgi:hypothetical protein